MSLRYAFFPGCIIPAKYPHFESATRAVAEVLDGIARITAEELERVDEALKMLGV